MNPDFRDVKGKPWLCKMEYRVYKSRYLCIFMGKHISAYKRINLQSHSGLALQRLL